MTVIQVIYFQRCGSISNRFGYYWLLVVVQLSEMAARRANSIVIQQIWVAVQE